MSPWQQPRESSLLPGTGPESAPASLGLCRKPRQRKTEDRVGREIPAVRLRMLGLPREPPTTRHPGSCGGPETGLGLQQSPTHVLWGGGSTSPGLPKTTLQNCSTATCQRHGCPTPTVLWACVLAKPQLPLQLPLPTVAPSPFQALAHPQPSFHSATPIASPLLPKPPWPQHQGSAFQTFPHFPARTERPHLLCAWQ